MQILTPSLITAFQTRSWVIPTKKPIKVITTFFALIFFLLLKIVVDLVSRIQVLDQPCMESSHTYA